MPCIAKSNAYDHDKIQSKLEKLDEQLETGETDYSAGPYNRSAMVTGPGARTKSNATNPRTRSSGFHKDSEIRSNASEYQPRYSNTNTQIESEGPYTTKVASHEH